MNMDQLTARLDDTLPIIKEVSAQFQNPVSLLLKNLTDKNFIKTDEPSHLQLVFFRITTVRVKYI